MSEMNRDEYLARNASKSTEMVSPNLPQETVSQVACTIADSGLFEVLLIGAASLAGCYFLYKKSKLYLDKGSRPRVNIFKRSQASCSKCRFFDKNAYLKCAVHPVRVGKPEAKDCTDSLASAIAKCLGFAEIAPLFIAK